MKLHPAGMQAHLDDGTTTLAWCWRIERTKSASFSFAENVQHLTWRYGRDRQEIDRLKVMDKASSDAPDGQISLTNLDARALATSARHSGTVGYNVQTAVDTKPFDGATLIALTTAPVLAR